MQDLIINTILSLITGLVSGAFVTIYYRNRDIKKEKVEYLSSLKEYIDKLCIVTDLGGFNIDMNNLTNLKIYKTIKFNGSLPSTPQISSFSYFKKEEQLILEKFESINEKICLNYSKFFYYEDPNFKFRDNYQNQCVEYENLYQHQKALGELKENWEILNSEIQPKINELLQKYKH